MQMAAKRLTKSQVISELAEITELDKKSISRVFEGLGEVIKKQLGSRGPGEFVIPGLLKLKAVKKPATKDRPGKNPFTGEAMTIKGKPASKKIRATALKALKDMIQLAVDRVRRRASEASPPARLSALLGPRTTARRLAPRLTRG
jgi:DNA-binding protein HU-beta